MPPNFPPSAARAIEFLGFGVRCGSVHERGGDADRAVFHGIAHQRFHLLELLRRGLDVVVSENRAPDLRGTDVAGQVDAHALFFEAREILAEGSPVGSDFIMLITGAIGLNDGVVERGDGVAFAGDLRGDALKDFRRQPRFDKNRKFGLAEHIDEAGRYDFAGGVDGALAGRGS